MSCTGQRIKELSSSLCLLQRIDFNFGGIKRQDAEMRPSALGDWQSKTHSPALKL